MIDLETLGVSHEAVILSIGAAKFDPADPLSRIIDSFHVHIDPRSAQAYGLKIEADAVMWWVDPARADARLALLAHEQIDLRSALDGFVHWYGLESLKTWSNGANFDIPIMQNALRVVGEPCPWKFWDERCFRTLKSLVSKSGEPAAHDALADAIAQAKLVQKIVQNLELDLG